MQPKASIAQIEGGGTITLKRAGQDQLSAVAPTKDKHKEQGRHVHLGMGSTAPSRGAEWFEDVAHNATRNPDSDRLVLGHFAREGASYQKVAAHYNASYFKVDDWNAVTERLSQDEIWKINETFLDQQIMQGKQILFSTNPTEARPSSFLEKEVNYLQELGYQFQRKNQWTWEAVR